jgi:hypothetical protein
MLLWMLFVAVFVGVVFYFVKPYGNGSSTVRTPDNLASTVGSQTSSDASPSAQEGAEEAKTASGVSAQSDAAAKAAEGGLVICPDVDTLINGYQKASLKWFVSTDGPKSTDSNSLTSMRDSFARIARSTGCKYFLPDEVSSVAMRAGQEDPRLGTPVFVMANALDGTSVSGFTFATMLVQDQPKGDSSHDPETSPRPQQEPAPQSPINENGLQAAPTETQLPAPIVPEATSSTPSPQSPN